MRFLVRRPISARAAALAVALCAACALSAALASQAAAGNYVARFCAQGVSAGGEKGPFERSGNQTAFGLANNCGGFNGLRISHNAGQAGTQGVEGRWLAERPEGISIARIDYAAAGGDQSGGYFPHVVGDTDADPELDIINGGAQLGGDFRDFSVAGDVRRFGIRLICQTDGGACAADPPGNPEAMLKNVSYTIQDPAAPAVQVTGGSLFEGPVQAGVQTVSFDASDAGSGVARVVVLVNGAETAAAVGSCALGDGFARAFKPCAPTLAGSIAVDTAAGAGWRNGQNSVQVCAEDYSTDGTANRTCSPAHELRALNGCVPNPTPPANAGRTLNLEWPGKRTAAAQTRQGRARTATARLFGPAGAPLAGAAVCFSRSVTGGSGQERVIEPGAITDVKGRAAVRVRGASSRTVYATYWVGPDTVITNRIELRVAPRIRIELRPKRRLERGRRMRIVAILRGKWKQDRRVCFYAERPGHDRVGCDRTGKGGRARLGYRPRRTGRTYFFAKVPNQRGYPYTNKRSKKKWARVRR